MRRKKGVTGFDESAPDDFDPANPYKDPVAMLEMREHIVSEKWIQIEKAKILWEKLRWCYSVEGINHLQKCRDQYLESTRGIGWGKMGLLVVILFTGVLLVVLLEFLAGVFRSGLEDDDEKLVKRWALFEYALDCVGFLVERIEDLE